MDRDAEFQRLDLEDGQRSLLEDLVDADRLVEPGQPKQFILIALSDGYFIIHPKGGDRPATDPGDVRALVSAGLLRQVATSGGDPNYEVTNAGRRYYAWMKQGQGEASNRVDSRLPPGH